MIVFIAPAMNLTVVTDCGLTQVLHQTPSLLHLPVCVLSSFWQSEQLVELLLNTIMLSVPLAGSRKQNFLSFSHGEYFYSLFQMTLNAELLSNLDTTVTLLMKAATQNPSMVSSSGLI